MKKPTTAEVEREIRHGMVYLTASVCVSLGGINYKGALIQTPAYRFTPQTHDTPKLLMQGIVDNLVVFNGAVTFGSRAELALKTAACNYLFERARDLTTAQTGEEQSGDVQRT